MDEKDKELLAQLNDPETLKRLGLKKADDEIDEILGSVELPEDATPAQIAKAYADRDKKLAVYLKNQRELSSKEAKKVLEQEKMSVKEREVDAFLKDHPILETNQELLNYVSPLYEKNGDLKKAYELGCKLMDLDPATGKPPEGAKEEAKEEGKEKVTQLKSDATSSPNLKADADTEPAEKKSIREILHANSNKLTAEGKNPFKESE